MRAVQDFFAFPGTESSMCSWAVNDQPWSVHIFSFEIAQRKGALTIPLPSTLQQRLAALIHQLTKIKRGQSQMSHCHM